MTNGNVTETVKALAGTPMLLVLVLLNLIFMGMITYLLKVRSEQLLQERSDMLQSLNHCMERLNGNGP